METIELRESDKRRAVNLNRKNGYGLDSKQMMRLINNHKKGDAYKCALIEFRLTDKVRSLPLVGSNFLNCVKV